MICENCRAGTHAHCDDIYWGPDLPTGEKSPLVLTFTDGTNEADDYHLKPGRYRSCNCQHSLLAGAASRGLVRADVAVEPATGPAGE